MRPFWLFWAGVACAPSPARFNPGALPGAHELNLDPTLEGISGIVRSSTGTYWLAPERDRRLWKLTLPSGALTAYPLEGVPEHLDLEDIALLPDGRFALATENTAQNSAQDVILLARQEGSKILVEGPGLFFDYPRFELVAELNRGLEGLCVAKDSVVAASETVFEKGGRRWAPMVAWTNEKTTYFSVPLTTQAGKISALACQYQGEKLTIWAIERHYEVVRLLKFQLTNPEPTLVVDIGKSYPGLAPNFEGLTFSDSGGFILISDNHHGRRQGQTRLLQLTP